MSMSYINEEYDYLKSEEIEKEMRQHPFWHHPVVNQAGTYMRYASAKIQWNYFLDYYKKYHSQEEFKYELPCLDALLAMAPILFDSKMIQQLKENLEHMNLKKYSFEDCLTKLNTISYYMSFFETITNIPQKQTELIKSFPPMQDVADSEFRDLKNVIYTWRINNYITVEKKGRFNYVFKTDDNFVKM